MIISFTTDGRAQAVYTEALPLSDLGTLTAKRASNVEFNQQSQQWEVRFEMDPGTVAFSHASRAQCIKWEVAALNASLLEQ